MSNIHHIFEYLPGPANTDPRQEAVRECLFAFRQGACPESVRERIAALLKGIIGGDGGRWTVCFVPASDPGATITRYYDLARFLGGRFPGIVYLNTVELSDDYDELIEEARRVKCHADRVKGMNVAVIDYIYNTGETFDDVERLLLDCGASSVTGICVAKVIRSTENSDKNY